MPRRKSQTLPIIVLVCLVVGAMLLRYLRRAGPPEINCGVHCGTERWQIKTVSDADAPQINWTPEHTSVSALVALSAPAALDDARADAEKKLYSVEAVLLGWKAETRQHGDRDFHLVLADPSDLSRTMIAEVPSTDCVAACNSSQAQHFIQARPCPDASNLRRTIIADGFHVPALGRRNEKRYHCFENHGTE